MSFELSDMYAAGVVSNCCGASVIEPNVCADCREHCGLTPVEDEDIC